MASADEVASQRAIDAAASRSDASRRSEAEREAEFQRILEEAETLIPLALRQQERLGHPTVKQVFVNARGGWFGRKRITEAKGGYPIATFEVPESHYHPTETRTLFLLSDGRIASPPLAYTARQYVDAVRARGSRYPSSNYLTREVLGRAVEGLRALAT